MYIYILIQYNLDYPTFGQPTFRIIWHTTLIVSQALHVIR